MSLVQHAEARKLLPILYSAVSTHKLLTYRTAAKELGRDPSTNSRMVAQVCDLLDAAAAMANVPLLALITVRELSGHINRKAWVGDGVEPWLREAIINRSLHHKFTTTDIASISEALEKLEGKSNRTAWNAVREIIPQLRLRLAGNGVPETVDAINDLGVDHPAYIEFASKRYARDPKVRDAVRRRAEGRCEYCGEEGFECSDGSRYLECHHIIALADDGEDRMTNVIALCPADHREAHCGKRRADIERKMVEIVRAIQARQN